MEGTEHEKEGRKAIYSIYVDMLKLCKAFNNEDVVYFTVIMIVFTFNM